MSDDAATTKPPRAVHRCARDFGTMGVRASCGATHARYFAKSSDEITCERCKPILRVRRLRRLER
jgi:hypothetical protein